MRNAITAVAMMLLIGCSAPDDPAKFTSEYYTRHPDERDKKIERCEREGGFTRQEQACFNARAALASVGIGSFKDLPPMGLLPEDEKPSSEQTK